MLNRLYCIIYKIFPNKPKRILLQKKIFKAFKDRKLDDYQNEINYIKQNKLSFIPYDFSKLFFNIKVEIKRDEGKNLYYVIHNGNKMYFPKVFSKKQIINMYKSLIMEQNDNSPHKYFDKEVYDMKLDTCIFVDCGAAEGIMSLDFVDKVKKVIIIESMQKWKAPLEATFEPWKEKVIFINKFLDKSTTFDTINLDDLLKNEDGTILVKMDIEGAERNALEGAEQILKSNKQKIFFSVCTYHRQDDFDYIVKWFEDRSIKSIASEGYVLWYFLKPLSYPYFRKCLIRANNNQASNR